MKKKIDFKKELKHFTTKKILKTLHQKKSNILPSFNHHLKPITLILYLTLLPYLLSAQNIVGTVTNQEKVPLAYVNVFSLNSNTGAYSNEIGNFELKVKDLPVTLIFSYIGYQNDTILIKEVSETYKLQVTLVPSSILLNELVITDNNKVLGITKKYGVTKINRKRNHNLSYNKGIILAQFFENHENNLGKLKKLKIRFYKVKNRPEIRIHCYEPTKIDGVTQPGNLVYSSPPYILKSRDKSFKLNLSDKNISFGKKGLFIAIEIISNNETKVTDTQIYPIFRLTSKINKPLLWSSFMGKKWHHSKFRDRKTRNHENLMMQLTVLF